MKRHKGHRAALPGAADSFPAPQLHIPIGSNLWDFPSASAISALAHGRVLKQVKFLLYQNKDVFFIHTDYKHSFQLFSPFDSENSRCCDREQLEQLQQILLRLLNTPHPHLPPGARPARKRAR